MVGEPLVEDGVKVEPEGPGVVGDDSEDELLKTGEPLAELEALVLGWKELEDS